MGAPREAVWGGQSGFSQHRERGHTERRSWRRGVGWEGGDGAMATLRRHAEQDGDTGWWAADRRLGLLAGPSWEAREAGCTESCRLARALGGASDAAPLFVGPRGPLPLTA